MHVHISLFQRGRQKEVDTGQTAPQAQLVRVLKSAVKTTVDKKLQQQWAEKWRDCSNDRALYSIITKPSKSMLQLHDKLIKRLSAIAIQLRTAKIGLQAFLYNRKAIESLMCSCLRSRQTIKHELFECRKLKELRRELWIDEIRKAKWRELKLKNVLIKPISLKKATILIEKSELIDYLRAPFENDEK